MGRWCCKRTGVLYLPALRLLRLYMYHENVYLEWCIQGMVLYYLWSWCKFFILPLLSKNIHTFLNLSLSYFYYILLFVLHFPDFSFRIQSFHWSKLKSIVMGHGLSQDLLQSQFLWSSSSTYTLLTRNTKSMAPEKNIISIPPTEDSFICTPPPPPPRILHSRGVSDDPTPLRNFQNCRRQGVLTTLRNSKWFLKVNTTCNSITKIQ